MLEVSIFVLLIVVIVILIGGPLIIFREGVINKASYFIHYIIVVICLESILLVGIGYWYTKDYVYIKKYLVTRFYYEEGKNSDIFNLFDDEQGKKMVFLADGKRYEVYASDIESRYDFADSKNKKGTTQLVVEIPKIKDSAPNFNKMFFNMSELCEIKVTRNIYK